jgi:ribosome maturation factor RimP
VIEDLFDALSPLLAAEGLEVIDVEVRSGLVRVTIDRDGGIDLDALTEANRTVSSYLDSVDYGEGRYQLEISSPGVERKLRTPVHFARALGETVSVRTHPGTGDMRRVTGRLAAADDEGYVLEGDEVPGGSLRLAYEETERAKTVFTWGSAPAPSPSRGKPGKETSSRRAAGSKTERVTTT